VPTPALAPGFLNLGSEVAPVNVYTSIRSQVGAPAVGSWRKFAEDMDDVVAARLRNRATIGGFHAALKANWALSPI
jgi:hypothetical protein